MRLSAIEIEDLTISLAGGEVLTLLPDGAVTASQLRNAASTGHPGRVAIFQCRRGGGTIDLRSCCAVVDLDITTRGFTPPGGGFRQAGL
jgi:hypothetical protein